MAIDCFLKIGGLNGESQDQTYKGWIDVLSWSWGMSQSGTTHLGRGGGGGKVSVGDISFTKYVDLSSPSLIKSCTLGQHFEDAHLVVRKAGDTPLEYLKIDFKTVLVSSFSTGGSGGDDRVMESITLNFREFHLFYVEQEESGAAGSDDDYAFNIAENARV